MNLFSAFYRPEVHKKVPPNSTQCLNRPKKEKKKVKKNLGKGVRKREMKKLD